MITSIRNFINSQNIKVGDLLYSDKDTSNVVKPSYIIVMTIEKGDSSIVFDINDGSLLPSFGNINSLLYSNYIHKLKNIKNDDISDILETFTDDNINKEFRYLFDNVIDIWKKDEKVAEILNDIELKKDTKKYNL